jgi:curved DNA-binding protein CbpA
LFSKVAAMVRENPDPYLVLGVSPTATQADITHAYRARLRAHHPDTRHTPSPHTADEHLRQLLAAYALLRDPARRADYDRATAPAATPPPHGSQGPTPVDRPPAGRVQIPITYRHTNTAAAHVSAPPLRAGPVRRHR